MDIDPIEYFPFTGMDMGAWHGPRTYTGIAAPGLGVCIYSTGTAARVSPEWLVQFFPVNPSDTRAHASQTVMLLYVEWVTNIASGLATVEQSIQRRRVLYPFSGPYDNVIVIQSIIENQRNIFIREQSK